MKSVNRNTYRALGYQRKGKVVIIWQDGRGPWFREQYGNEVQFPLYLPLAVAIVFYEII